MSMPKVNTSASKRRLLWTQVPPKVKAAVENMAGGQVVEAANCEGGFSPGLASRLTLADSSMIFVKGIQRTCPHADAVPDRSALRSPEAGRLG
jgi:hypothetical protein